MHSPRRLDYAIATLAGIPMVASILACTVEVNLDQKADDAGESDTLTITHDGHAAEDSTEIEDADTVAADVPARDVSSDPPDSVAPTDTSRDGDDAEPSPDSDLGPSDTATVTEDVAGDGDATTADTSDTSSQAGDSRPGCSAPSPDCPSGTQCLVGRCVDRCTSSACPHPSRNCISYGGDKLCLNTCNAQPGTSTCGANRKCMLLEDGLAVCRDRGPNMRDETCNSIGGSGGCGADLVCTPSGSTNSDSRCLPFCDTSSASTWCATGSGGETCTSFRNNTTTGHCRRTCDPTQRPTACKSWERCVSDDDWPGTLSPSAQGVCVH